MKNRFENSALQATSAYEQETTKETLLPTREMPVASVSTGIFSDTFPEDGFSHHEGIITYSSNETIKVMPDNELSRQQLSEMGLKDLGNNYEVPFTGAGAYEQSDSKDTALREMAYNLAGIDAGLNVMSMEDYTSLSQEQRDELSSIGFQGTEIHNRSLLSASHPGVLEISVGDHIGIEEVTNRAKDIGTFARVRTEVGPNQPPLELIAYTDQNGNQVITKESEAFSTLRESLGYRELPEPTFNTDVQSLSSGGNNKAYEFLAYSAA